MLSYRRSRTVSIETYPLYSLVIMRVKWWLPFGFSKRRWLLTTCNCPSREQLHPDDRTTSSNMHLFRSLSPNNWYLALSVYFQWWFVLVRKQPWQDCNNRSILRCSGMCRVLSWNQAWRNCSGAINSLTRFWPGTALQNNRGSLIIRLIVRLFRINVSI